MALVKSIHGLLKAGLLEETTSPCNTPIYPVRKPHSEKWRLVHDLRAINDIVQAEYAEVPDPSTLLSGIPPDTKNYTVIDLCSVFFRIPLHPLSRHLFAFTFDGKQYQYTQLPQGYCESPSVFNRLLAADLANRQVPSTVTQYVDDLLICSSTKEQCEQCWPTTATKSV